MKSPVAGIAAMFVLFVVLIVGYSSVFTVDQTEQVLVVRYEQLHSDPGVLIARIWAHWGVTLRAEDVAAGVRAGGRETMIGRLDPASTEVVMPDPAVRAKGRLSPEDRALLWRTLAQHLRHTLWPTVGQISPRWPPTALKPRQAQGQAVSP